MEVQGERKSRQLHTRFVVHRKVYALVWDRACALHRHLLRFQLYVMRLGSTDHGFAEILIRIKGNQPDIGTGLRRKVVHVLAESQVGQFARNHLPASDDGQRKNSQPENEFPFSHRLNR